MRPGKGLSRDGSVDVGWVYEKIKEKEAKEATTAAASFSLHSHRGSLCLIFKVFYV